MKLIEPQSIRLLSSSIHEHRVYKAVTARTGKQPDQHCEGTDAA